MPKASNVDMNKVRRASFLARSSASATFIHRQQTMGGKAKMMEEKRILIPTNFKINYAQFRALEEDDMA